MTADPCDSPTIVTIGDGFQVRQAVDNIAWIDLGEYALVVDALEEAHLAEEVFDAIETALPDKPIRYVLNTHTHYDHTALNAALQRRYGAEIVNSQTTDIPPDGRWFAGSRRRALMLPMPHCHTPEDCIVRVEPDKVLFVGDIFGWGLIPCGRLTAQAAGLLLETYQRLIDFGAATVIPGHGPVCTTAELERWVEYFKWLTTQTTRLCSEGKSDSQIAAELTGPQDMLGWWRFVQWKHQDSLDKVLRGVRSGQLADLTN